MPYQLFGSGFLSAAELPAPQDARQSPLQEIDRFFRSRTVTRSQQRFCEAPADQANRFLPFAGADRTDDFVHLNVPGMRGRRVPYHGN